MKNEIKRIQDEWKDLNPGSISRIRSVVAAIAADLPGLGELHRDERGFILLSYAEEKGTYRRPHDHGDAWVIYVVVSGEVEMGGYVKVKQEGGKFKPFLIEREKLSAGDARVYYPGDIHDTRCLSEKAVILRLTSGDLKEEERLGRMSRFEV
jgi:hypothetical protein